MWDRKNLFFVGLILASTGLVSPPLALVIGLAYGIAFQGVDSFVAKDLSKFLLQASVVGLGFGMNLHEVIRVGRSGFVYTAVGISLSMIIGLTFGQLLGVDSGSSLLISVGTAICGGSAIAAVGPIADASDEQMAISLGTIFILNSVALLTFPLIGWALHMTQTQFGLWSALSIHDTSSVAGAAARYGSVALVIGMTVKLARALWIVPVSILTAVVKRSNSRIQWPWFILFFCLAAMANTYVPAFSHVYSVLDHLGKIGISATLYLIGAGLSKKTLEQVGFRPLVQGVALWAVVAVSSLLLIRIGWIRL